MMAERNLFDDDPEPQAPQAAPSAVAGNLFDDGPAPAPPKAAPLGPAITRGAILPFSRDAAGRVSFDPLGSGIIGGFRQAATLPGRVVSGETKVDPNNPAFIGEALNFAGSFGAAVNPAIRSGDRVIPGVVRNKPDLSQVPTPTGKQLLEEGGKQIEAFMNAPVRYNPQHFDVLAQQIESDLVKKGIFPEDAPGIYQTIARLRNNKPPPGSNVVVEPGSLISIRENIANKFGNQNEHQKGVGVAFDHINKFIENPPAGAVLAGPAAEAAKSYAKGRANYAAGMRDKELADIKRTADLRAASANSGQNADNTLRSRITSHVLNDKKIKGYTDDEVAMLEGIPLGTTKGNVMRAAGNMLGGGGGLGSMLAGTIGAATGGLFGGIPAAALGVAAPAAGWALKRAAGKSTEEALDAAAQTLRQRSPLFQQQAKAYGAPNDPSRNAIARQLLLLEARGGQGLPVDQSAIDKYNQLRNPDAL